MVVAIGLTHGVERKKKIYIVNCTNVCKHAMSEPVRQNSDKKN
jgi:hypothetical protein